MKIYETFTTDLARDTGVTVLYGAILGKKGHDVSIEAVWNGNEVIMPFGMEPEDYMEKPRLYKEAKADVADKYYQANWNDD